MKEYLPYIVSVVAALLSFIGSLLVSKKNNKAEIEKLKLEHEQIMERNKQEQEAKLAQIEKEYALKMGADMITSITGKTMDAVYSTPAMKTEMNKQNFNSFVTKKGKGKKK